MKLNTKIILSIFIGCVICTAAAVFISTNQIIKQGTQLLIDKNQAILSRLESVRGFVATQGSLKSVLTEAKKEYPDGNIPHEAKLDILKQVPIFASMKVGSENSTEEGYTFRVFSEYPRNKDNKATASEASILARFLNNPNLKEQIVDGKDHVTVYRPVRLSKSQGCLACHGDPNTSPWGNGKDILGHQMENWKDGRLHGAFAIISSKAEVQAAATKATRNIILWSTGLCLLILLGSYMFIRQSMNSIATIIDKLEESGISVAKASSEISSSSQDLSSSSTRAAASIEQTTAATEEMSSMINLNAGHTNEARVLAVGAQDKARNGKNEVENLIVSMDEIAKSSKKIEEIISVIDDIAFQTNLLALNAAVEAARAGEQGKGFAVVADAVRALAQRSATSAKEISLLIKDSVHKIENGHEIVIASGSMLNDIVGEIEKLTALNIEISTASSEQAAGVSSINMSITELDQVTQKNAAAAEESAAAADLLSEKSQQMHSMVLELIAIIQGKRKQNTFAKNIEKNEAPTISKSKSSGGSGTNSGGGSGSSGGSSGNRFKKPIEKSSKVTSEVKVLPFKNKKPSAPVDPLPMGDSTPETEKSATQISDAENKPSKNNTNEDLLPLN